MNKQALTEALARYDEGIDYVDPEGDVLVAAARLVERLLPGECRHGYLVDLARVECPVCHGSGQVWDEGIVEAVAKALSASLFDDWDGLSENLKGEYRKQAVAVLSALVELLTEKVET